MPILLKAMVGLSAAALVGLLTAGSWPRIKPPANSRPTVERPLFVARAATTSSTVAALVADKATMDKLALALRGGSQPAAADAAAPSRTMALTLAAAPAALTDGEAARLRAQGLIALADGDVASARAFLERAAEAGDARALLVLGDTYDPATLARMGAVGLKGDAAQARAYYARALSAGVAAARQRIAPLESTPD